jgi:cytochrome c
MRSFCTVAAILSFAALNVCGCTGGQTLGTYTVATGGYPKRGVLVIKQYRCGTCHTIPGISGAHGVFAPPLTAFSARTYIAGQLPNTPENLSKWIMSPPSVKPKTAMPILGLTPEQARDAAAYLYTLR